jgi:hypothetical protein
MSSHAVEKVMEPQKIVLPPQICPMPHPGAVQPD